MDIYSLNDWINFQKQVDFRIDGPYLEINSDYSPFLDNITLLFYDSGNFTLKSNYNIVKARNVIDSEIVVCISEVCNIISPGEVVTFDTSVSLS